MLLDAVADKKIPAADLTAYDVRQIRSARIMRIGFEHNLRATGKIVVEGDTLRVLGDTERTFPRRDIMAFNSSSFSGFSAARLVLSEKSSAT